MIDRSIGNKITAIVAVSRATRKTLIDNRNFLIEKYPIKVIYNSVPLSKLRKHSKNVINLKKKFNIRNEYLIGIMGRIEQYKGHEDLIIAFSMLSIKYRKKIKLIFIGQDIENGIQKLKKTACKLGVEEYIIFTGYLPGESKLIISQLDLLAVMTRSFEGFGLTLFEAISVDVPILATRVGAIPEFLNEKVAKIIPPESPYEASEAIIDFINNRQQWENRAKCAKKHIARYSVKRMVESFNILFRL